MATQADVAAHLYLDQAVVSRLLSKGVLPAAARGQLDMDRCRKAYIEHIRASAAGRDSSKPGSLEAERARLAAAQADAQERKNQRDRGELGSVSEMRDAGVGVIVMIVAQLQRVGARVAGTDVKLRQRIDAAIEQVLTDLSMTRVEEAIASPLNHQSEHDDG